MISTAIFGRICKSDNYKLLCFPWKR